MSPLKMILMSEGDDAGRVQKRVRLDGAVSLLLLKLPVSLIEQSVQGFRSLMTPKLHPAINKDGREAVGDPEKTNNQD